MKIVHWIQLCRLVVPESWSKIWIVLSVLVPGVNFPSSSEEPLHSDYVRVWHLEGGFEGGFPRHRHMISIYVYEVTLHLLWVCKVLLNWNRDLTTIIEFWVLHWHRVVRFTSECYQCTRFTVQDIYGQSKKGVCETNMFPDYLFYRCNRPCLWCVPKLLYPKGNGSDCVDCDDNSCIKQLLPLFIIWDWYCGTEHFLPEYRPTNKLVENITFPFFKRKRPYPNIWSVPKRKGRTLGRPSWW